VEIVCGRIPRLLCYHGSNIHRFSAGSEISLLIAHLGDANIAEWFIFGPLVMQNVLFPVMGRLSGDMHPKFSAAVPCSWPL
jgi:hypothetical protein